jgi:hypothetical protein
MDQYLYNFSEGILCFAFVLINNIKRAYQHLCSEVGACLAGTSCGHSSVERNWRTFLRCSRLSARSVVLEERCDGLQSGTTEVATLHLHLSYDSRT